MSQLLHLMRHDVRQHSPLLLAWTLLVVAQPFFAVLFRGDPGKPPAIDGVIPALFAIGSRLLVGAVLAMTIVQQDAPLDDRTFWRTRPIAPSTMAAAKLMLVALTLLGLPLLVTLGVAVVAEVPFWYWPTIAFQVLLVDGTLVGVALVSAALTRHLSTGLVVAILTVMFAFAIYSSTMPIVVQRAETSTTGVLALPDAMPTLLLVIVVALWTTAAALWWGARGQQRALTAAAAATLATLVVWYIPAARLHRRPVTPMPPERVLRLSSTAVRALMLPTKPERIAIVTDVAVAGLEADALAELWLLGGTLTTGGHEREARGPHDPNVGQMPGQPLAGLLAVVSPDEFAADRGRPAQFRGRYRTSIVTGVRLAEGPLAPTTRLVTPLGRLQVSHLATESGSVAAGYLTVLRRMPERGRGLDLFLRDAETGRRVGMLFVWHVRTGLSHLLQLPTLARPFEWDRIEMRLANKARSPLERENARVEMREVDPPVRGQADAQLTFTMPSDVAPAAR